jgi:DNA-binding NtrC family response regulator
LAEQKEQIMAKIAIIHAKEHIRLLFSEELREAGYEVATHSSTFKFLEFVADENPNLIILGEEVENLEISSEELVLEIKKAFPLMKIIFATCYDTFSDRGVESADDIVVISFDLTELKKKIGRLLET